MSNGLADLTGPQTFSFYIPAAMTGATVNDEAPAFVVGAAVSGPVGITLVSAKWTPAAAVTANGTNFSALSLRNRGAAFAGAALPFSRSYAATNSAQGVAETMTPSVTAADLLCVNGDVLTLQRIATAAGLVLPAGLVTVTFTLR